MTHAGSSGDVTLRHHHHHHPRSAVSRKFSITVSNVNGGGNQTKSSVAFTRNATPSGCVSHEWIIRMMSSCKHKWQISHLEWGVCSQSHCCVSPHRCTAMFYQQRRWRQRPYLLLSHFPAPDRSHLSWPLWMLPPPNGGGQDRLFFFFFFCSVNYR